MRLRESLISALCVLIVAVLWVVGANTALTGYHQEPPDPTAEAYSTQYLTDTFSVATDHAAGLPLMAVSPQGRYDFVQMDKSGNMRVFCAEDMNKKLHGTRFFIGFNAYICQAMK